MCKCTPYIRTPFCGKIGCEWPEDIFKKEERPPLGVMPRRIWLRDRIGSLCEAIQRIDLLTLNGTANLKIWADELNSRVCELYETEKRENG